MTGAEGIHPGYGFMAENPDFAEMCREHGITFIGPTPESMRALGSKAGGREIAALSNVPVVPGTGVLDTVDDALLAAAPLDISPAAPAAAALTARIVAAHPRAVTPLRPRRSFGWPNVATLAAAALAGFIVGWADFGSGSVLAADNESDLQELFTPTSVIEDSPSLVEEN